MTYLFDMNATLHNPQENFDRLSGYVLLLLLLLIVTAIAFFGIRLFKNPLDLRIISFEQVGNLKIDDPVKLQGITIGTIMKIESHEQKVLVFFETQTPLKIHQGYHIDDKDIGLMGDRIVMIIDGDSVGPLIPKNDTLTGTFHNGVSETVGFAWKLRDILDSFTVISSQILHGTPKRKSLIKQVHEMVDITDSASSSIMNYTVQINKGFNATIDSIEQFVTQINKFSGSTAASAPGFLSTLEGKVKDLAIGVNKLDAMSDALLKYTRQAEKSGLAGLGNESQIKGKIDALHDAIGHLKDRLLKFQVYFK
jgi:phospholipid/cholesterol/gamma-HCH transport system substrate-binding protein